MQNDFDKTVKDKLSGYSADFNPADWGQMEKMLPEKSRKPYALFALLLLFLGVGGLVVGTGEFQNRNNMSGSVHINSAENFKQDAVKEFKNENPNAREEKETLSHAETEPFEVNAPTQTRSSDGKAGGDFSDERRNNSNVVAMEEGGGVATKGKNGFHEKKNKTNSYAHEISSGKKTADDNQGIIRSRQSFSHPGDGINENFIEEQQSAEIIPALAFIESGFIDLSHEGKFLAAKNATSDAAVPKHKQKRQIVTFALGGGAGINFSFINAARWTKPGYAVDLNEELMFINRIGIALSQGYTERKYDGGQLPCSVGALDCPYSYNSTARSVDFGVTLKANLIHETKWNWYIKTGIINIVKLKEGFSYDYPQTDTLHSPALPPKTNFHGGGFNNTNESLNDQNAGLDARSAPFDLSVSGAKRGHIAFLSATGFDIALKPNLNVQMEVNHSFTQPTVGVNNKRLHTIGVNARCFYLFGR